jgi:16S rRNA C967 or C1407 C5-methylase (RsmB/RsmF family)/NOL1/NOP2/fmu family ribosome biogenesis protein
MDAAELAHLLRAKGYESTTVPWSPGALRCAGEARPGLWWPYRAGLYSVQEEASLLPVALLDPRPGERVLDLCAAPGGKTAQVCMALKNRGTVIANDRDSRRLAAVRDRMKRLGLLNLTTTAFDGRDYPLAAGPFDRVLVDAPCSAEGANFRKGATYAGSSDGFRQRVTDQQRALLRRAVALTRPGGRIVYSTCSLAPEENEAIVDAVLREDGSRVRVAPPPVDDAAFSPGIAEWEGRAFHPDIRHAIRLWPHIAGTSGFSAVVLERIGPAETSRSAQVAELGSAPRHREVLAAIHKRYGLPDDAFEGLTFAHRGDHVQAIASDHYPPASPPPVAMGVPFLRAEARIPKPTTAAAFLIGRKATRNVVELDRAQRDAYQTRQGFAPTPGQLAACDDHGYVILRYRGRPLGVGLLRPGPPARIDSQFPRAWVPHAHRT